MSPSPPASTMAGSWVRWGLGLGTSSCAGGVGGRKAQVLPAVQIQSLLPISAPHTVPGGAQVRGVWVPHTLTPFPPCVVQGRPRSPCTPCPSAASTASSAAMVPSPCWTPATWLCETPSPPRLANTGAAQTPGSLRLFTTLPGLVGVSGGPRCRFRGALGPWGATGHHVAPVRQVPASPGGPGAPGSSACSCRGGTFEHTCVHGCWGSPMTPLQTATCLWRRHRMTQVRSRCTRSSCCLTAVRRCSWGHLQCETPPQTSNPAAPPV